MHFIGDIYVSEILHKPVLDPRGEEVGTIVDFTIVLGELFPRASGLMVRKKNQKYIIPWDAISVFNRKVISTRLPALSLRPVELGKDEILACRNLLDKQIVDINGAKVVRVNDLKLGEVKGNLCLIAVDVGMSGLLRRLGLKRRWDRLARLLGYKHTTDLISWNFLQPLEPKLSRLALTVPRNQISTLHPSDIAQIISEVSQKDRKAIVDSLDIETAAETIHELEPGVQADIIGQMDTEKAADLLEAMPPDEAADLMGDLSEERAQAILGRMETEEADEVQELLGHEEDTAGGLMTTDYLSFPPEMSVEDALREYRLEAPDVEMALAYTFYIMAPEEKLLGEVQLRDLISVPAGKTLEDFMQKDFRYVSPDVDQHEVAEIISKYNLLTLPVLDGDGKLLGVVTVDDVVDLLLPPQSRRRKHRIG